LNRIDDEAKRRGFRTARIDLNEGDVDPFSLFYKIYDAILYAAVEGGAFAGLNGPVYRDYRAIADAFEPIQQPAGNLLFPKHWAAASKAGRSLSEPILKADLSTITREVGRTCVLLFDECDVLSKSRIELELLRNIFMNTPGYMLVFAGTPNLFPVMEDVFSPIVRQFKKISVEKFSDVADTESCITRPLASLKLTPEEVLQPSTDSLVFEVHQLSAGRPYEIQLLCHCMFKRVETGDARDMAITLDVLDDVRQELEKQESGSDRSSITSLRQLETTDFELLQSLTEFRGTVSQLSASSELFRPSQPAFDEDTLETAFQKFAALGLVQRDDAGVVRFTGDQFDEIYARYFAAANSARLFVWQGDFKQELSYELRALLRRVPSIEVLYFGDEWSATDTKRRVSEAITALLAPENRTSLPDAAGIFYGAILRAFDQGKVVIAGITLTVLDTTAVHWITVGADRVDEFLTDPSMLKLTDEVKRSGGLCDVEILEEVLPEREDLLQRIAKIASPNQFEDFAEAHYAFGFELHQKSDYSGALREFSNANDLRPTGRYATSAAHASLLLGDWKTAAEFAEQGRSLAWTSDEEIDLDQYSFGTYDLAVSQLLQGNSETAIILLEEVSESIKGKRHGFLATPESTDQGLIVTMIDTDDVLQHVRMVLREARRLSKTTPP
jgi:tetratricopeptide (TPR) repeat protein